MKNMIRLLVLALVLVSFGGTACAETVSEPTGSDRTWSETARKERTEKREERKAEREARKAEREQRTAEREQRTAEREQRTAEREQRMAERELKKTERDAIRRIRARICAALGKMSFDERCAFVKTYRAADEATRKAMIDKLLEAGGSAEGEENAASGDPGGTDNGEPTEAEVQTVMEDVLNGLGV